MNEVVGTHTPGSDVPSCIGQANGPELGPRNRDSLGASRFRLSINDTLPAAGSTPEAEALGPDRVATQASLAAPVRRSLVQEGAHALLSVGLERVLDHHGLAVLVGVMLGPVDLRVERLLAGSHR